MIDTYVTGASGFIGKRLMAKLGDYVFPIPHKTIPFMPRLVCRRFFFLGAYGNMAHHQDAKQVLQSNVIDLASIISTLECESFVYVSSSSVTLPVQTPYSRTKRAAEEMLQAMPLPVCIVRPYSVCGKSEQPSHLIPTLIRSCMEGEPMKIVLDSVHDFINVDDVVEGLITLGENATGVFELGTGIGTTNQDVCSLVEMACGKRANVTLVDSMREYDSQEWLCRDSKALDFGWKPKRTLAETITEMVEDYKATPDRYAKSLPAL